MYKNFLETAATFKALDQYFDGDNSKNNLWNKSAEINSKKFKDLNIFNSKENKKSDKTCSNLKNSSTLSLHISAYENSVVDVENEQDSDENACSFKQNKFVKSYWKSFKDFGSTTKNPFEMSRQQIDGATEPEIMQFKASKKLLNPNMSSSDSQLQAMNIFPKMPLSLAEEKKSEMLQAVNEVSSEAKNLHFSENKHEEIEFKHLEDDEKEKFINPSSNKLDQRHSMPDSSNKLEFKTREKICFTSSQDAEIHKLEDKVESSLASISEKEKSENLEVVSKENRSSLIQKYEKKLEEFFNVPKNAEDISKQTYSRELILLLHEINKTLNLFPCPVLENELQRIGIDRASVTVSYPSNRYAGSKVIRFRATGRKQRSLQRVNIDRTRCGNPFQNLHRWEQQVFREKKLKEAAIDLLNNLTSKNLGDSSVEIMIKSVYEEYEEIFDAIVDPIFKKVIENPDSAGFYADFCLELQKIEQRIVKKIIRPYLFWAIIKKSESSFDTYSFEEWKKQIKRNIVEEQNIADKKELAEAHQQLQDMNSKEKQRMIGSLTFVIHLFKVDLLKHRHIEDCVVTLVRSAERNPSEFMIKCVIAFIKHLGLIIAQKEEDTSKFDGYVTYVLNKFEGMAKNWLKFMFADLKQLQANKWV
uniref:MIF4G domain-containing protein n=1 Tax=Panagrolaimus sp. ES5 TaxID=591445 RepID=A0AC34F064_9BILA